VLCAGAKERSSASSPASSLLPYNPSPSTPNPELFCTTALPVLKFYLGCSELAQSLPLLGTLGLRKNCECHRANSQTQNLKQFSTVFGVESSVWPVLPEHQAQDRPAREAGDIYNQTWLAPGE
jgi:hypothetical protein